MTTNPVIEFKDYKKIGTMETALSEHADEAFHELPAERQKVAEKIFKCLTETDRENRVIRRATTVDKLCAVAGADIADVIDVIEIFRKEGRTFLMPPPEVPLRANSLIDISHESLIRKWERLTKWVEEEGQSAQLYRRLAEDALLNLGGKVGFWSEPELSEALDWRDDFKPNETWAELYREKGERQYKASFAESMKYLDDSRANRDAEIAEDERQQSALKKYATNLRRAFIGLIVVLVATIAVAAFAWTQRNQAIHIQKELGEEKKNTDALNGELRVEKQNTENAYSDLRSKAEELQSKKDELSDSLDKQKKATDKAEKEKNRADKEANRATLSEAETQKALEQQKLLAAAAKEAETDAIKQRDAAKETLARLKATTDREEFNRRALTSLEQGEYVQALVDFEKLLESYENQNEPMSAEFRTQGKWWASHNLGIVNTKINRLKDAETFYRKALELLGEPEDGVEIGRVNSSRQFFQPVSFSVDTAVNRSKIATLRRLAQLYRSQVETSAADDWMKFTLLAKKRYNRLLELMEAERFGEMQTADVYVELADTLGDSYDGESYEKASEYYMKAAQIYETYKDFAKEVSVLKKMAELDVYLRSTEGAYKVLSTALRTQESKKAMNLPPVSLDIADTYDRLAKVAETSRGANAAALAADYSAVARLIGNYNFKANIRTTEFTSADARNLADAYVKIGRCARAEQVYNSAFATIALGGSEYTSGDLILLNLFNDTADFYHTVMRDEQMAQHFFLQFLNEHIRATDLAGTVPFDLLNENSHENAGDFYLARKDFFKAELLYKDALKIIEAKLNKDSWKYSPTSLQLTAAKAELLVKKADLFEAQNKITEAEGKYREAINAAPIIRDRDVLYFAMVMKARVQLRQAGFYERSGNTQKALQIYTELARVLSDGNVGGISKQQVAAYAEESDALLAATYKKLGDLNRHDPEAAHKYYFDAAAILERFEKSPSQRRYSRYFRNDQLTAEYYDELAGTYEAWVSVKDLDLESWTMERAKAVRQKADELKLEEQKSPCEEDD